MPKMSKSQVIDAMYEWSGVAKNDGKTGIENMATVGYTELDESAESVIPGFVKMSVVNKPATEAHSGFHPFTKEPMEFAAKPASKTVRASPLKAQKTQFRSRNRCRDQLRVSQQLPRHALALRRFPRFIVFLVEFEPTFFTARYGNAVSPGDICAGFVERR